MCLLNKNHKCSTIVLVFEDFYYALLIKCICFRRCGPDYNQYNPYLNWSILLKWLDNIWVLCRILVPNYGNYLCVFRSLLYQQDLAWRQFGLHCPYRDWKCSANNDLFYFNRRVSKLILISFVYLSMMIHLELLHDPWLQAHWILDTLNHSYKILRSTLMSLPNIN